ncbi:MAG: 50S ribosomal protein L6 [Chloroflexi bacterium]|nr:50S ribosomal protein L6 [Chloroflexota bacterium]
MSRVGQEPIDLPSGVEVKVEGGVVTVSGPKGQLAHTLPETVSVAMEGKQLSVSRSTDDKRDRALHGLTRALLANMVLGVTQGFTKSLEVQGVGYRAQISGQGLTLTVGYSHKVDFPAPPGISYAVDGARITISGIDKQLVGQVAARLRAVRPPDAYTGKGLRYFGELIKLKPGKAAKKVK